MRCPNCGRENPDIRLFCSLCGELLPEKEAQENRPTQTQPETPPEKPEITPDTSEDTDFFRRREHRRRITEEAWPEEQTAPAPRRSIFEGATEQPDPGENSPFARPEPRRPEAPRESEPQDEPRGQREGRASTLIPPREAPRERLDPDDFFAVKGQVLPPREREAAPRRRREMEDPETGSFAMRHIRGIVGLLLLLLTVAIMLIWASTDSAQRTLARMDMAWRANAYGDLGMEAYEAGEYSDAGYYFTQALKREKDSYAYALYAANSYINGGYTAKALTALRACIALRPEEPEPYVRLMEMQGGYEFMTESDQALIREGYRRTGDERLKME